MPQSLANLLTHLIFSTKNREPFLADKNLRQSAHAYLAAVLKDQKCPAVIVGGIGNHVHILCHLAKTESVSNLMEHLKASSSKWLKTQGSPMFAWQRGYGAFSVSQSQVDAVVAYIQTQEEHHRTITSRRNIALFSNATARPLTNVMCGTNAATVTRLQR